MTPKPSPLVRAAIAAALLAVALGPAGSSLAATPCSKAVLEDWRDNSRIDRVYELQCYEAAIDAIPSDLLDYTDAQEVIARAFQSVSGRRLEERKLQGPQSEPPLAPGPGVVPPVDASASTSVPLPLLVLGGMSAMLLAAGGLGYVSRRRRERTLDG